MRWDDERYVRFYTRDTPEFLALSWRARGLFGLILRKVDRAGILAVGKLGPKGVAVAVGGPWSEIEAPLYELLEDGCIQLDPLRGLIVPNFMAAQEAPQSDAARKRASRERARAEFGGSTCASEAARRTLVTNRDDMGSQIVTESHVRSRPVTSGHSVPSRAEPSLAEPEPLLRAPACVESDPAETENETCASWQVADPGTRPEGPSPTPPEDTLTLAETFAAVEAKPFADLDALAHELAGEGNQFGKRCCEYLDKALSLPHQMRAKLREIAEERAKPRPGGVRRVLTLSAEEQALVAVYVAALKRIRREDVPQLELHGRAAQRILPDIEALAKSCSRPGFEPTPADVLAHKLETYLRLNDPRLAEQGYPLSLVLTRTDATDLPKPKRPRERSPPGPEIKQAEPRPTPEQIDRVRKQWGEGAVAHLREETGT